MNDTFFFSAPQLKRDPLGSAIDCMDAVALVVSLIALGFSIYTFWWLHWRPATLVVGAPPIYAGFGDPQKLLLEFPFVFYNDGPRPIIVDDLRLRLPQEGGQPLAFNATVQKIGTSEGRAFAVPFAIGAKQATSVICEFQRNPGALAFEARDYKIILEGRLNGTGRWAPIRIFTLRVTEKAMQTINGQLLTHDNPV